MKRLLRIVFLENKINRRTAIFYILALPLLYFMYYSICDGITSLTFSAYVVQILILGTMLIGYQTCVREERNDCKDVMFITSNRYTMVIARLLAALLFVSVLCLGVLVFVLTFAHFHGEKKWIVYEAILYWALYYWLVGIISVLFGQIIGLFGRNKLSYLVMLLISVSIGPLGKEFVELIATILHIKCLRTFAAAITIGQYDAYQGFNYLYGFEIESKRFYHRLLYICILYMIFNLIYIIKRKKYISKCIIQIGIFGMLSMITFSLYNNPDYCRKTGIMEDTAQSVYDVEYYEDRRINKPGEYRILSMDLDVNLSKILKVSVEQEIELEQNTDELNMTLYHDLKVDSVYLDGEEAQFIQNDDVITVISDKDLLKGDRKTLSIQYGGISSQYYFAGEKATYLPGYFAWVPYPGKHCAMELVNGHLRTIPLVSDDEIEYTLQCVSGKDIYCNLDENNGVYLGNSRYGVTLISGNLESVNVNGINVFYTADKKEEFIKGYVPGLIDNVERLSELLSLAPADIRNVFLIPTKTEQVGKYAGNSMVLGDTLISGIYDVGEEFKDEYLCDEALIGLLTISLDMSRLDSDAQNNLFETIQVAFKDGSDMSGIIDSLNEGEIKDGH